MNATTSWETLLRTPRPGDHLIQLYTDEAFLAQAVAQFVGRGLAEGAAAVVIATPAHVDAFTARLAAGGLDVPEIVRRGQLVVHDAEGCLATFMVDGMPDRAAFFRLVRGLFDGVRAAGHMSIRVFAEMVNLLWDHNLEATVRLEELWNEVLADQGVSLLCAYRIDNFDRHAHRGVLHQISRVHSHLIPLEDYERFDRAVDRAYGEVFGTGGDAEALRELLASSYRSTTLMPPAQAALLALRELPQCVADTVLERARHHYGA
jgi:hypothetical protein